jgi:hypothetical protein
MKLLLALAVLAIVAVPAFGAGATATVSPKAAKEGTVFAMTVRGMKPNERVVGTESLPFGQTRKVYPRAGKSGALIVKVKGQVVGTHKWCFKGRASKRQACTSYRVRKA